MQNSTVWPLWEDPLKAQSQLTVPSSSTSCPRPRGLRLRDLANSQWRWPYVSVCALIEPVGQTFKSEFDCFGPGQSISQTEKPFRSAARGSISQLERKCYQCWECSVIFVNSLVNTAALIPPSPPFLRNSHFGHSFMSLHPRPWSSGFLE